MSAVTLTPRRRKLTMRGTAVAIALAMVATPLAVAPAMANDGVVDEPTQGVVIEEVTTPVEESVEEVVEETSQEVTEEPTEQVVEEPSQDSFVANTAPEKVWVCKVVRSENAPGGYALKEGKQPIHVSSNALDDDVNPVPGAPFSDAQPSFVVAEDDVQLCLDGLPKGDASAAVSTLPATCELGEKLVYGDISNATFSGTPDGTTGPGDYSVTATADTGYALPTGATQEFNGSLSGALDPSNPACAPPTATDCLTTGSFLVTNENEQGFNYSPTGSPYADTRVDGQYEYVDGALRLTTLNSNDASSTNKVSGARAVDIPLAEYGGDFTMNFVASYGTILPGINIRVDADNNGTNDVTLVAEPNVPGYLTFWTNTPGYLPASQGGQGGAYAGDQDDFLALWPDARVKVEAFALGSGVGTDGDLVSWSTPCNTYTYDYVEEPEEVIAYIDATVDKGCTDVEGTSTPYVTYTFINETDKPLTDGQFARTITWVYSLADGSMAEVVQPVNTGPITKTVYYTEDQNGGSLTALVGEKGQQLREVDVDTDCVDDVPPSSPSADIAVVEECSSADVTINYPAGEGPERTWEITAAGEVLDTVTLNPGDEPYEERFSFPEDFDGGSVDVTLSEVDAPVQGTTVTVDTNCEEPPVKEEPPVLAHTGSNTQLINGSVALVALLLAGGAGLVWLNRRRAKAMAAE